jgi:hypothetical protein
MSAQLGNGTVTFGDGTVQSTKTPTNISAFTNDQNYLTSAVANATYATKLNAMSSVAAQAQRTFQLYYYDVHGTYMGTTQVSNCNCNC